MGSSIRLCLLVLATTLTFTSSRVPPRQGWIQHPAVLTRQGSQASGSRRGSRTPYNQNINSTLPEPMEADDDLFTTTPAMNNFANNYGQGNEESVFDMGNFMGSLFYDMFTGGTGGGGMSWEFDDDFTTTQATNWAANSNRRRGPSYSVYTTPKPTTTTSPEPPELDDDLPAGSRPGALRSGVGSSGYCFCSPLRSCPSKSIPRGGLCVNFLTLFTRARFIRCCYSPSMAKRIL